MSLHRSNRRGRRPDRKASIGSWGNIDSMPCLADTLRKSPPRLSQETKDFIIACAALRRRLAEDGLLTREEKDLIEFSALEMLNHVKPLE